MGLISIQNPTVKMKDEDDFNDVYSAVSSSNVELLEFLLGKLSCKNSTTPSKRMDEILSRAYDELKLKNVFMTIEMEFFVQNKLVDLRFFSQKEKVPLTVDNIEKRINLLIKKINILCTDYSSAEVDEKFLYISKFIAHSIHILKQQLKSTYKMLPWEEIEFCLVLFVSAHTKRQEINLFSQSILTKDKILNNLNHFSKPLEDLKNHIKTSNFAVLGQSCICKRELTVKKIINRYPSLGDLYDDYKELRDVYSFYVIKNYIDAALLAQCDTTEGQLSIDRALQVAGEHIKNTLGSPKLSETSIARLQLLAPKETTEILKNVRDSLSHTHFLKYEEGNELLNNLIKINYSYLQNDLRKINTAISEILFCSKVEKISFFLSHIINSNNLDEMCEIFDTLRLNLSDAEKIFHAGLTTNEDQQIEELVKEISGIVTEKNEYEKEIFNKINKIIECLKDMYHNKLKDYSIGCTMLNGACFSSFNEKNTVNKANNSIAKAMILKASEIHNFFSAPSDPLKIKKIQELGRLLIVFYQSVEPRIPPETALELRDLLRIFFNAVFAKDNITETDKFSEELIKNKYNSDLLEGKCKQKKNISKDVLNNLLNLQLARLKSVLSNPINDKWPLSGSDNNKFMIEMSVLEVMNTLKDLKCLVKNVPFLDDDSPVLTGGSLRNHIAHRNAMIDILYPDNFFAVFANAVNLAKLENIENCRIGKTATRNIKDLVRKYERHLNIIKQKEEMCNASIGGNLEKLKKCLKKGADAKSRSINLRTPLHHAARGPSLETVQFLLSDHHINASLKDLSGQTPLHIASAHGRTNIVQYLIKEVHLEIDEIDNTGKTPLIIACQHGYTDTVEELLSLKADKDIKDLAGWSSLHHAVENNKENVVKVLLDKGVDVGVKSDGGGFTSLHLAAENGNLQLTQYLLQRNADKDASNTAGERPLHLASVNDHLEVVNFLINAHADKECKTFDIGCTPLCYAVRSNNVNIVRTLLEKGANVKICDKYKQTNLHTASNNGNRDIVGLLIEKKPDFDAVNCDGETPMLCAARKGHKEIFEILINNHWNHHCTDNDGSNAFHLSAKNGHGDIIRYLIKNKIIDINTTNKYNQTPLHLAAGNGHFEIVDFLLEEKADVHAVDVNGSTALHLGIVSEALDLKNISLNNYTPLRETIVNLFISHEADVNIESRDKGTPLHLASLYGHSEAVKALIKEKKRIDPETSTEYSTALHLAAAGNHKEVVKILINNGVDMSMINEENCTALDIAVENNYEDLVKILIEKGAKINGGKRPLTFAILQGYRGIVKDLLENEDIDIHFEDKLTGTPLHTAALIGDQHLGKMLIDKKPNLEAVYDDHTPLSRAVYQGHTQFVDLLLKNGAIVNSNVLHIAIKLGYLDIVESLCEKVQCKTKNNIRNGTLTYGDTDEDGGSLLYYAAKKGQAKIAHYLIEKNVDVNFLDENEMQPIHAAAQFGHLEVVKLLLDSGSIYNGKDNSGKKPSDWTTNEDISKLLKWIDSLFKAVRLDNIGAIEKMIKDGISLNAKREDSSTLLHFAAWKDSPRACDALLKNNADPNALGKGGHTPLHYAAKYSRLKVVKSLLTNGAIYNVMDDNCKTPIDHAAKKNVEDLLKLVDESFTKVKKCDVTVIDDLTKIEDVKTVKAVMKACNKDQDTLIVAAINSDFPQVEKLEQILDACM